ncbi:MAG: GNAT family N-acetyltransferase [Saprospiraceae bacterium]|nr:GNAT family N-acetyltransferase [Saprospiraceae bacterium]
MKSTDAHVISDLHVQSWKKHYKGIVSDHYLEYIIEKERFAVWQERCTSPSSDQLTMIAEVADSPCGFVCAFAYHHEEFGAYIDNLHVLHQHQGQGIGFQLLVRMALEIHTFDPTIQECYLWVFEKNNGAIAFYERAGGKKEERENRDCPDGASYPCLRYSWQVNDLVSAV